MKFVKTTPRKKREPRKTPYIVINGVKADTLDTKAFWEAYLEDREDFTFKIDKDGDIIIESKER